MGFSVKKAVGGGGKAIGGVLNNPGKALGGGAVGGAVLGPIGAGIGALSAGGGINDILSKMHGDAHRSNPNADIDAAVAGGPPAVPGFTSLRNDDGTMKGAYNYNPSTVNFTGPDTTALNKLQSDAMNAGPSAWASLAQQQNQNQTTAAKNNAAQQALSGNAMARAQMAMGGGLSSGSAERIARSGASGLNQARQTAGLAGNTNALNVSMQDATQKQDVLKSLPGMQLDIAKFNANNQVYNNDVKNKASQFNIQNQLGDATQQRAADLYKYGQGMSGYAAAKTGQAIGAGGGKGGK